MHGFSFSTAIRVRFAETDAQGIAHNSNYLVWFEVARVEYLEQFAGGYQRLRDLGVEALVLESHVRYLAAGEVRRPAASFTRAASTCAARASATSTRSSAAGELIADGWTRTRPSTRRRCGRRACPPGCIEAIASAEQPEPAPAA